MKSYKLFCANVGVLLIVSFLGIQAAHADTYTRDLTVGSSGVDVVSLQTWLINNGFAIPAISSNLSAKGYFGTQTRFALAQYQQSIGLPNFGYFGTLTRQYLNGGSTSASFSVVYPGGGETWLKGSSQNIIWTSPTSATTTTQIDISLIRYQPPCTTVCNAYMPAPILVAADIDINQHSYSWNVGSYGQGVAYIPENPVPSIPDGLYLVRICLENDHSVCATSKKPFTISTPVPQSPVTIVSPNGGDHG